MANTTTLGLPLMAAAQSQKHITHNDALLSLDVVVQLTVISASLTTPPVSPTEGDRYIVGSGATGAWDDKDLNIAYSADGAWIFVTPRVGWLCWNQATSTLLNWNGTAWVAFATSAGLVTTAGAGDGSLDMLSVLTAADTTNRLAVKSNAILFSHDDVTPGTGDIRVNVNKAASGDDASFVFQDAYSARAMFGLLGDDDFSMKVSPDGSSYFTGMVIDKDHGGVAFPSMALVSAYLNYDHYATTTWINTDVNVEDLDVTSSFASGVFTAPRAGVYKLGYSLGFTQNGVNTPNSMHGRLLLNGSTSLLPGATRASNNAADSGFVVVCVEGLITLAASDTVRLQHKFSVLDGYASANITRLWVEQVSG